MEVKFKGMIYGYPNSIWALKLKKFLIDKSGNDDLKLSCDNGNLLYFINEFGRIRNAGRYTENFSNLMKQGYYITTLEKELSKKKKLSLWK